MKKLIVTLLAVLLVAALSFSVIAEEVRPVYVTLNGEAIDCESYGQSATIVEGRTLVPLRAIFEALGASVEWDQSTKTVTSTLNDTKIKLAIGENTLYVNGEGKQLDVPAQIMNNRTMVPARAVAEAFGVEVSWDKDTRTVILVFDKYVRGTVENGVYESEYLGIKYTLPEGFTFASEGELRRIMGIGEAVTGYDIDFDELQECYEFLASDELGNNIQLITYKTGEILTLEEALSASLTGVKEIYEELGLKAEVSDTFECVFGTKTFTAKNITISEGFELVQTMALNFDGKRWTSIVMAAVDAEGAKTMLEGFLDKPSAVDPETIVPEKEINLEDVPEEALEVAKKYFDASLKYNLQNLDELCVDSYGFEELGITNIGEMLEYIGFDEKVITEYILSEAELPAELYGDTMAELIKTAFDFLIKYIEKAKFEITDAEYIDENTINLLVELYLPDANGFNIQDMTSDDLVSEAVMKGIENGEITENSSQEETMAVALKYLIDPLKEMFDTILSSDGEYIFVSFGEIVVKKTEDGSWKVVLDEEALELLTKIKNKEMPNVLNPFENMQKAPVEKHHAYGKLYLGMTLDECFEALEGEVEVENGDTDFADVYVTDEEGIYNDEDEKITGKVNCDYMELSFYEGYLYSVYVTTPYSETKAQAEETLGNIIAYYGEDYEYDEELEEYVWVYGDIEVCSWIMDSDEGFYCCLDITDWS